MFAAVFAGPFCSSVEFLLSRNVFVVMGVQSEPKSVGNPLETRNPGAPAEDWSAGSGHYLLVSSLNDEALAVGHCCCNNIHDLRKYAE
jgi:hypothetical protein